MTTYGKTMAAVAAVLALAACGGGGDSGEQAASADSAQSAAPAAVPADSGAPGGAPGATAADGGATTVSFAGLGPVRVGMSAGEARSALGGDFRAAPASAGSTCQYARSAALPSGVKVMLVDGRVARVEVDSGAVATAEGARIGSTEAEVQRLYPGRVKLLPHKYDVNARYLVVSPASPADSARRIVFESDSSGVTRYRAGKTPEVEWVEGCA